MKMLEYSIYSGGKMRSMSWGVNMGVQCLSLDGEETMWEGTREERGSSGLRLLRSRCRFAAHLALTSHRSLNMRRDPDLNATLLFWKAQFCRVGLDPRMEAAGQRGLTALVLGLALCYPNILRDATSSEEYDTQPIMTIHKFCAYCLQRTPSSQGSRIGKVSQMLNPAQST